MSKALNELKKATMASYLSKAGGRVRSATKISGDFEADHYKAMATANKHHPNMVTPGFEKDPEKLKKAETQMKVTGDLRDTFKRDAANRIKGIARAGRLLAKEETIDEGTAKYHKDKGEKAYSKYLSAKSIGDNEKARKYLMKSNKQSEKETAAEMKKEETVEESFVHVNGATATTDATAKKHGGTNHTDTKTGTIYKFGNKAKASVFKKKMGGDAHHWSKSDVDSLGEETVNEVSRSTIAKVATARYNQAQKALKDKDYGGYVNKMKKAIKASDATTPKTGWSPEEDPKNEEVISPQEKYRQIREAKIRNRKGK